MKKNQQNYQDHIRKAAGRQLQLKNVWLLALVVGVMLLAVMVSGCSHQVEEPEKVVSQKNVSLPGVWDWWPGQPTAVQAEWMWSLGFQPRDLQGENLNRQRKQHGQLYDQGFAHAVLSEPAFFDRDWFLTDQVHFQALYHLPDTQGRRTKLYLETLQLQDYQQKIIQQVRNRHPLYRLYSPKETDAINSLFIAANARRHLLKDSLSESIMTSWDSYYPAEYTYTFFQMKHLNLQGGIENATVEVMDDFTGYDEAAIHGFLDGLPAPSVVYHGKEVFFVNGANEEYGAVHANGQILVFNLFEDVTDILKLLAHEVGHEVGYLIFGRDGYENQNNRLKEAYAGLYGYPVPNDERVPWGARLSENFAEDFAWVYGDFPKWSWWEGAEKTLVQHFIEKELALADMEEAVLIRDNVKVYADQHAFTFFSGFHEEHMQVIIDPHVQIVIDGFQKGPYQLYAHVRNNVTGNLPRQLFADNGVVTLNLGQLPEEQQRLASEGYVMYEIQIKLYHYTSLRKYHQPTIARFWIVQWAGW